MGQEEEKETTYCANCETEAVWLTATDAPLCYACGEAYRWGQASPDSPLTALEDMPAESKV